MLETQTLSRLKNKKNLLAFSAGGDSTALLFLLLQNNIKIDIAIVDYGVRDQSKEEVQYAKELAEAHKLTCHTFNAPKICKNFESIARDIRYKFFEELIRTCKYDNLITAHHLGDRLEWMLMQFCKGAGCAEIAGMQKEQDRGSYKLIRPLLHVDKNELLEYLHVNDIRYFEDETNNDKSITRNAFRHNFSEPLLKENLAGIKKSFEYLDEDRESLLKDIEIKTIDEFAYFKSSTNKRADIFVIDKYLKSKQHMPTANERELLKIENTTVLGRKFVVNQDRGFVFIMPYTTTQEQMSHEYKERCRLLKIEPKLRPFLYKNEDAFAKMNELLATV